MFEVNRKQSPVKSFSAVMWSETSLLTVAAADLMWALLCFQVLAAPAQTWQGIVIFFTGLVFTTHLFIHFLDHFQVKQYIRIPAMVVWVLGWVISGFRVIYFSDQALSFHGLVEMPIQSMMVNPGATAHFVTMVFILLGIWRSIALANPEPGIDAPNSSFYLGLFVFIVFTFSLPNAVNGSSLVYFLTFLFLGMVSLATGRISGMGEQAGGRLPQFKSVWLTWILGVTLTLVIVAFASGLLLNGPLSPFIDLVFNLVYRILLLILITLGLPILLLIEWIINRFMVGLDNDAFDSIARTIRNLENSIDELQANQQYNIQTVIDILHRLQPWIIGIGIGLIILFTVFALNNRRKKRKIAEGEESTSVYLLPADKPNEKKTGKKRSRWDANRYLAAMRIRQTYMRLLDACEKLGTPRPLALTPLEFLPVPTRLFPQHKKGVDRITQAYIKVRYGEIPEDESEVEQILTDWSEIKEELRSIQARKRRNP